MSIEQFGIKDGFGLWFRWSFTDPIKMFYWKWISARPYCPQHGYFLCNKDCKSEKITGRRNIIKYHRERDKRIEIEGNTIREGEKGKCYACNTNPGEVIIDDPNWDTIERWKVCKECETIISQTQLAHVISSIQSIPVIKTYEVTKGAEL